GFYRFFDRYARITGQNFYQVEAPTSRGKFVAETPFLLEVERFRERFLECMDDDFNTGGAVGALYELLTTINRFADTERLEYPNPKSESVTGFQRSVVVLKELGTVLGLFHVRQPRVHEIRVQDSVGLGSPDNQAFAAVVQVLIDLRNEARKAKNFALGDQIRKRLGELGVILEDRPSGTGWRIG
ncbi:MAG TPA: DALR domain-containing protein, partial [Gemmataceae bacterium]|nr:DALR domain-containing protein [Gemmataceae bacterium]